MNNNKMNVIWFKDLSMKDVPRVGGKNASLGEMISTLKKEGIRIPDGFATTSNLYWEFLEKNDLRNKIDSYLQDLVIHPHFQRKGIGTKLAKEAIRFLKKK